MYAQAQLNIVPKSDGLKEYTVTNAHPYDSLTNVEKRSFASLPGQTLYMHGARNDGDGYWDAFYTSNFLAGDDRTVYKAVNISSTPAKEVVVPSTRPTSLPGMTGRCTRRSISVRPPLKRWSENTTR